jgi:hypothetical protein
VHTAIRDRGVDVGLVDENTRYTSAATAGEGERVVLEDVEGVSVSNSRPQRGLVNCAGVIIDVALPELPEAARAVSTFARVGTVVKEISAGAGRAPVDRCGAAAVRIQVRTPVRTPARPSARRPRSTPHRRRCPGKVPMPAAQFPPARHGASASLTSQPRSRLTSPAKGTPANPTQEGEEGRRSGCHRGCDVLAIGTGRRCPPPGQPRKEQPHRHDHHHRQHRDLLPRTGAAGSRSRSAGRSTPTPGTTR